MCGTSLAAAPCWLGLLVTGHIADRQLNNCKPQSTPRAWLQATDFGRQMRISALEIALCALRFAVCSKSKAELTHSVQFPYPLKD
jgi:hypothetical protein